MWAGALYLRTSIASVGEPGAIPVAGGLAGRHGKLGAVSARNMLCGLLLLSWHRVVSSSMHPNCASTAAPRAWLACRRWSGVWGAMGGREAVFRAGWVGLGRISAWGPIVAERHIPRVNMRCRVAERVSDVCPSVPIAQHGICSPSCAAMRAGIAFRLCTARIVARFRRVYAYQAEKLRPVYVDKKLVQCLQLFPS